MTDPQFAHIVVPDPVTHDHYVHTASARDAHLATELAKYHAARAQGFWLAVNGDQGMTPTGVTMCQYEYHLAALYFSLATTAGAIDHLDEIAATIGTTMRWAPQEIGPTIHGILEWAGIDPTSITAYTI
jgi:hypothetical protein